MTDTPTYRAMTGNAAERYEEFFVPAIATPVLAELMRAAEFAAGERVLDVACGTGAVARRAAPAVGDEGVVVGVDLAPEMIDVARGIPTEGAAIDWRVAEASSLPFPDASFDVVTCQMGMMFFDDPAAALEEMCRVVAPGGRVIATTPGPIQPPFEALAGAIAQHVDPALSGFVGAVFSMRDPDRLSGLFSGAGLTDVETTTYTATLALPTPIEFLWRYIGITPMAATVEQLPDATRTAMEADIVAESSAWTLHGDVLVEQPILLARGRRP